MVETVYSGKGGHTSPSIIQFGGYIHMAKKIFAGLVLAVLAFFSVPAAANAAGYVPSTSISGDNTVVAGGTTIINFAPGSFAGSENVSITITGAGSATVGAFKAETITVTKQAAADGSLSISVKLPAGATGTYSLTATGVTSGNVGTYTITVVPADSANGSGSGALPDTGSSVSMLAVWAGAGALLLGAALIAVMTVVRRQRLAQD
jgi:LPXTG-motif cell wall-anchored protein